MLMILFKLKELVCTVMQPINSVFFSFSLTSHNHIFLLVSSCKSCIHQPSVSTLWSVHVWAFIMTYESEFKLPEVSVSEHLCHSK